MGGAMRAPDGTISIPTPIEVPKSFGSLETWARQAVARETMAPDVKTYSAAKTTIAVFEVILCRHRTRIPLLMPAKHSKFSRPSSSPVMPVITLAKNATLFRLAVSEVEGELRIHAMGNSLRWQIEDGNIESKGHEERSANETHKSYPLDADGRKIFCLLGGRRARMQATDGKSKARMMKPQIRTVHPKLRRGLFSILLSAMGKMTQPREEPATATPMAAPRFFLKYWAIAAVQAAIVSLSCHQLRVSAWDYTHTYPIDKSARTPCTSANSKNDLQILVMNTENTYAAADGQRAFGPYRSNSGPPIAKPEIRERICKEHIQGMAKGE